MVLSYQTTTLGNTWNNGTELPFLSATSADTSLQFQFLEKISSVTNMITSTQKGVKGRMAIDR